MNRRIAVIDFPQKDNKTSWFVVNDSKNTDGKGGLVKRIEEHGFKPELIDYRTLDSNNLNPADFAAVFYASGYNHIRDTEKEKEDAQTREINPALKPTCEVYDKCIDEKIPVVGFTHGSEVLAFYTGGDYSKLPEERKRFDVHAGYKLTNLPVADKNWLLKDVNIKDLAAREYRRYKSKLEGSPFNPLVYPYFKSAGPSIAVHEDPAIMAVLFMMHPEYDKDLSAYKLMENVFAKIEQIAGGRD
ncbi:MAG: hypothetical protein KAK00_09745 [Nanoarchaeota archaeon]|nr:hypothetical protein [Nanoarchaeota archaeon]